MSAGNLISGIEAMSLDELRSAWTGRLGAAPPKLRTRELLAGALAYRLQVRQHGDLKGPAKRKVAELGRRFLEDRGFAPSPGPNLKPGCSIVKEWRGVRHEVRVLDDGFAYDGGRFGSLSEVAQRITGTKWNGNVFFGLKARRR